MRQMDGQSTHQNRGCDEGRCPDQDEATPISLACHQGRNRSTP
jgi:hypothetical protein